ncbi:MAG TPA: hypothetical protein VGQ39_26125 [Pyrinomonadaceae bacterium]|nr:hypothetical protein [Pyrinomonadaceae bacterium]
MQQKRLHKLGNILLKVAADINYWKGTRAWGKENYADAAKYFDRAMQVKADHAEASYWFRRARERTTLIPYNMSIELFHKASLEKRFALRVKKG